MPISTTYVLVLVNGSSTSSFAIGHGLRQCYPLSLMLFNLVVKALSVILKATSPFAIGRELRHGCSLSPMLFNLVVEALSAILRRLL
ncbi:hypothetical protein V6N13_110402 [Hibiscus sabdariffa]